MMKIVVLGGGGYIGRKLCEVLRADSHEVVGTNRAQIDFGAINSYEQLSAVLSSEKPRVVINAVGTIDSRANENPHLIFNALFLPTYDLFRYYADSGQQTEVHIYLLGSTSAGEPRRAYPLYAAMKAAEVGLLRTASEVFADTAVSWREITVPRLNGGLALSDRNADNHIQTLDIKLEALADTIRKEISKLTM
jgi:nucleoside-diphosphate-sugar epimerase